MVGQESLFSTLEPGIDRFMPSGLAPDIAEPRVYEMKELLRSYLQASHRHRLIIPIRLPGKAARAFRASANLAPEQAVGHRTWEDFLADRLRSGR